MQPHTVRVIYIVPIDAKEWLDAKHYTTEVLEDLQHFFADEMNLRGHGPKTFEIARDADNELLFEAKHSPLKKAQFQADPIKACQHELSGGRPRGAPDIELCFFEAYSIVNGVASVPGAKTRRRRCYLNSLHLKIANRDWLHDVGVMPAECFPGSALNRCLEQR